MWEAGQLGCLSRGEEAVGHANRGLARLDILDIDAQRSATGDAQSDQAARV